jgi:mannose-1-phosphate guanylyltransferase
LQALILAGGEGTRLRPLTSTLPKPVIPLVGRPFIAYMIEWLGSHGVDDVILSCGFMADAVRSVLGEGSGYGVRLRYLDEPEPLGTGGALKFAEELLDERFFMLNGDILTDMDLTAQLAQHERPRSTPTSSARGPTSSSAPCSKGCRRRARTSRSSARSFPRS